MIFINQLTSIYPGVIESLNKMRNMDFNSYLENYPFVMPLYEKILDNFDTFNIDFNLSKIIQSILSLIANFAMEKSKNAFINIGIQIAKSQFIVIISVRRCVGY